MVGRDAGRDPDPVLYLIHRGTRLLSLLIHKLSPQNKPWYGTKGRFSTGHSEKGQAARQSSLKVSRRGDTCSQGRGDRAVHAKSSGHWGRLLLRGGSRKSLGPAAHNLQG